MRRQICSFWTSLAASTLIAFGSLAISYGWANRELVHHFAREGQLLNSVPSGIDYESMTSSLAAGVSLVVGLIGFSSTAILGISRRPWYHTALVLAPAAVWLHCLIFAFVLQTEEYFP